MPWFLVTLFKCFNSTKITQNKTLIGCLANKGQDLYLELSPQGHILCCCFFFQANICGRKTFKISVSSLRPSFFWKFLRPPLFENFGQKRGGLILCLTVALTMLFFWIYFFFLMLVFVLQWLSLHWEILIILLSQFPLTFHQTQNQMPRFIAWLMTILVLIGMVFMIIWEMFHGRISLNSVLLLLLANFVSGLKMQLMYISLILSTRWNLTHLHGFHFLFVPRE